MSLGLFILRVIVGVLIAAHGSQKLFGWFGGYGLTGTGGFFEKLGFRPGRLFAAMAGASELLGGLLVVVGLLGPVGPVLMLSVMIVAAVSVHWPNGLFAAHNGIEVPMLYAAVAVALIFSGPGQYSLDAVLALSQAWTPVANVGALAAAAAGGAAALVLRHSAPAPAAA